jgi:hypothetical protein
MILSFENSFEKSYDIIKNKIFEKLIWFLLFLKICL